jgi:hypothetical protein
LKKKMQFKNGKGKTENRSIPILGDKLLDSALFGAASVILLEAEFLFFEISGGLSVGGSAGALGLPAEASFPFLLCGANHLGLFHVGCSLRVRCTSDGGPDQEPNVLLLE